MSLPAPHRPPQRARTAGLPLESGGRPLDKILVANRGEIAIRIFRAATELGLKTVALYTYEDRYSLHRYKADEAYQIGRDDDPLKPYLDIEGIIRLAKDKLVDAIHPGYGFLSENVEFARRCRQEGIIFVGPSPEAMEALGNKMLGKQAAERSGIPTIPGAAVEPADKKAILEAGKKIGLPVMVKAVSGGGGRGMRVVREEKELVEAVQSAAREAEASFGDARVFLEKFLDNPRHIEVQIVADAHGHVYHLFERDCSVQRRHQKVVEVAPSSNLKPETTQALYDYAVRLCQSVQYDNVGTVEFLVSQDEEVFFIEVNPRIQVEHTVTEEITRVDLVRTQILVARGLPLDHPDIGLPSQEAITMSGYAIQCRITTEDPEQDFKPDIGTIIAYRSASGFGIRLDEGNLYTGVRISPYFDSLLVKVSATGRTLRGACRRLDRALMEFRIRGVVTNIGFVQNLLQTPEFQAGLVDVGFIGRHPELFRMPVRLNRATRLLEYLGHVTVNGHPDLKGNSRPARVLPIALPEIPPTSVARPGTKQQLAELGPEGFSRALYHQRAVGITDTALRDAHQSLFATRMRTYDMLRIAPAYAHLARGMFALETWGGATFDVALRFLNEDPWDRLIRLREAIPNILFRMLLRGRNAVGYGFYSLATIEQFVAEAWRCGLDVFRIFDSFNDPRPVVDCVRMVVEHTGALAEAAVCYSGDLASTDERKFTLDYYLRLAEPMVEAGAHMLCIKDMAGLIKPASAERLVPALRERFGLPVHLHTHDTSSVQAAAILAAIEAGVDGVDLAIASLSGLTSQPNLNATLALLKGHPRRPDLDLPALNRISDYFEGVRTMYQSFEPEMRAGTAEVYDNEIPGGQYSNLRSQARALGLEEQFAQVRQNYQGANQILGRIIKVTPSSKAVGDMALFMTANGLTESNFFDKAPELTFPESVKALVSGEIGTPPDGWPEGLPELIVGDTKKREPKPLPDPDPEDFARRHPERDPRTDMLSELMYPKVFEDYAKFVSRFGEVWYIPTLEYFYGLEVGQEVIITISPGKDIIVKLVDVAPEADEEGRRAVTFEINGTLRVLRVEDEAALASGQVTVRRMASAEGEIGAPMPGRVSDVLVKVGDKVDVGQALFILEAMKMESNVAARQAGKVTEIVAGPGSKVEGGQLVLVLGS